MTIEELKDAEWREIMVVEGSEARTLCVLVRRVAPQPNREPAAAVREKAPGSNSERSEECRQ